MAVTAERIAAAGGRLISEARCAHEIAALAERIRASGGDLVLIAGASAITDRRDVLPAAIEAAGGAVEHFGMPVDPGNLLLLAHIGERAVLGLPAAPLAQAERLRLGAGAPGRRDPGDPAGHHGHGRGRPAHRDPDRPQPREAAGAPPGKVAALVLAAGQSRRMGQANKLLAPVDGRPMVAHAVDAMLASRADPVIVVTGHQADAVRAALAGRPVIWAHNPDYASGLSSSLAAGLAALPEDAEGVVIGLGDMPRASLPRRSIV